MRKIKCFASIVLASSFIIYAITGFSTVSALDRWDALSNSSIQQSNNAAATLQADVNGWNNLPQNERCERLFAAWLHTGTQQEMLAELFKLGGGTSLSAQQPIIGIDLDDTVFYLTEEQETQNPGVVQARVAQALPVLNNLRNAYQNHTPVFSAAYQLLGNNCQGELGEINMDELVTAIEPRFQAVYSMFDLEYPGLLHFPLRHLN